MSILEINIQDTIKPLVRQYSLEAEKSMPDDILGTALASTARKDEDKSMKSRQDIREWRAWLDFSGNSE